MPPATRGHSTSPPSARGRGTSPLSARGRTPGTSPPHTRGRSARQKVVPLATEGEATDECLAKEQTKNKTSYFRSKSLLDLCECVGVSSCRADVRVVESHRACGSSTDAQASGAFANTRAFCSFADTRAYSSFVSFKCPRPLPTAPLSPSNAPGRLRNEAPHNFWGLGCLRNS